MKTIYISGCFAAIGYLAAWACDDFKKRGIVVKAGVLVLSVCLVLCSWLGVAILWLCDEDKKDWFNKELFRMKKEVGDENG